jgi:hypothetical protein
MAALYTQRGAGSLFGEHRARQDGEVGADGTAPACALIVPLEHVRPGWSADRGQMFSDSQLLSLSLLGSVFSGLSRQLCALCLCLGLLSGGFDNLGVIKHLL